MDQIHEYSFLLIAVKKENVPFCNPDIFAFYTSCMKCYFHPLNNHVKAIQHTFTVTHGPDTKAHDIKKLKKN